MMIKKLLSTFLFFPALAIASAEIIHFESVCLNFASLEATVKEHNELPFVVAVAHRLDGEKKTFHPTVMFVNPKTKSWTLAEKLDDGSYCIIAVGSKLEPYKEKK